MSEHSGRNPAVCDRCRFFLIRIGVKASGLNRKLALVRAQPTGNVSSTELRQRGKAHIPTALKEAVSAVTSR